MGTTDGYIAHNPDAVPALANLGLFARANRLAGEDTKKLDYCYQSYLEILDGERFREQEVTVDTSPP